MSHTKHGACLCGAIRLAATVDNLEVNACHCSMCRTWAGGPMLAVHCSQPPRFEGADPSVYRSSEWAERGFCGQCGTHLYYRLIDKNEYALPVGLLKGDDWQFTMQIYVEQRPSWYCFSNETQDLTGEQVMQLFS